jgi:hypothetical protein
MGGEGTAVGQPMSFNPSASRKTKAALLKLMFLPLRRLVPKAAFHWRIDGERLGGYDGLLSSGERATFPTWSHEYGRPRHTAPTLYRRLRQQEDGCSSHCCRVSALAGTCTEETTFVAVVSVKVRTFDFRVALGTGASSSFSSFSPRGESSKFTQLLPFPRSARLAPVP